MKIWNLGGDADAVDFDLEAVAQLTPTEQTLLDVAMLNPSERYRAIAE